MSAHPYMPLYVADYLADTAHLTTEENGAYILLIMTYWRRGKPLPADSNRLANIARIPIDRWTDVERTLSEFFSVVDGEWRHKRIDAELSRATEKVEKARVAGKASARRRHEPKPISGEPPVQRVFNGRSTDVQPSSESDSDLEVVSSSSEQEAAREKEQDLDFSFGRGKVEVDGKVRSRAEGFGLPVAEIDDATRKARPRNPTAYFRSLCVSRLGNQIPHASAELITKAMDGNREAFTIVTLALMREPA